MTLGSTQPLAEMSTWNLLGEKVKGARRVRLTQIDCLENVEASTSDNPMGLHGLLTGIALPLPFLQSNNSTVRLHIK
jgi:hypothetical protein